jgi:glutamate dehydrogenase
MHPSDLLHLALPAARLSASTRRPVRDLWGTAAVVVERLDLAWLVDAVWKLPRATRWEALARIQLRDELTDAVLGLAVATGSLSPDPADPAWLGWLERNRRGVSRLDQVRGLLDRGDRAGLAALSVAVRSLSRLAGAR